MMKLFFVTVFLFFFIKPSLLCAQTTFVKTFGGSGNELGRYVVQTNDGGFMILTEDNNQVSGILKTNANGDLLWSKSFLGPISHRIHMNYLQQTKDSGLILCGTFGDNDSIPFPSWTSNIYIIRTSSLGDSIWSKIYDLTPQSDIPNYIEETSDSGFILTGESDYELNSGSKFLAMKTDKIGDSIWTKQIGVGVYNTGHWIYQSSDDGYIAGATISDMFIGTSLLFKMNSLGDTIWSKSGVVGTYSSKCSDGGFISGADLWVTPTDLDIRLIKIDSVGNVQWDSLYGCSGYDGAFAVQQTFDGGYVALARNLSSCDSGTFSYIFKTNSIGNILWKKIFPNNYTLYSLQQTPDSGFILTGFFDNGMDKDILLIKTDINGNSPVSINEISETDNTIIIYPNPFSATTTLKIKDKKNKIVNAELKILDILGRTVKTIRNIQTNEITITRDNLVNGIYFYQITDKNNIIATGKFIIE